MAATKKKKKKKISFFLFPLPLGQICFVLVLISPNHKARNRYPEMVMARTATRFDNNALKLMSISDVYGLQRLMSEPTRIRPTSATLIDLIYANFTDKISNLSHRDQYSNYGFACRKLALNGMSNGDITVT